MSSNRYAVLNGLSNQVAQRTIQVTVVPRPAKFAERRAVLHSLQKFANVEVFKKLEKHNSSFISVVSNKSQAQELVNLSPLRYEVAIPRPNGSVKSFLTEPAVNNPVIKQDDADNNPQTQETETDEYHKEFTLHIFPAETYIHSAAIRSSPLHGPWPESRRGTVMSATLKASLPKGVAADGLSDWETGGQVPASAKSQLWEDILLGTKSVDVGTRAIIDRIRNRENREKQPAIMDGLLHLKRQRGQ